MFHSMFLVSLTSCDVKNVPDAESKSLDEIFEEPNWEIGRWRFQLPSGALFILKQHCVPLLPTFGTSWSKFVGKVNKNYWKSMRFFSLPTSFQGQCGQLFILSDFVRWFFWRQHLMKASLSIHWSQPCTIPSIPSNLFLFLLSAFAVTTEFQNTQLWNMPENCEWKIECLKCVRLSAFHFRFWENLRSRTGYSMTSFKLKLFYLKKKLKLWHSPSQPCEISWPHHFFRSIKDPHDRNDSFYLNELIYLGRIYDYETENEHLVTAFQQFLDQMSDRSLTNETASVSFSNIILRVTKIFTVAIQFSNSVYCSWPQNARTFSSNASSKAKPINACCLIKWWSSDLTPEVIAVRSTTFIAMMTTLCEYFDWSSKQSSQQLLLGIVLIIPTWLALIWAWFWSSTTPAMIISTTFWTPKVSL